MFRKMLICSDLFPASDTLIRCAVELKRVSSPSGTDIDEETPGELALGIVGELVKVRSKINRTQQENAKSSETSPCCRIQTVYCLFPDNAFGVSDISVQPFKRDDHQ